METAETLIIGAGIFGSYAAASLAETGHDCILVEALPSILGGATAKNQNRLHVGLHYPRDFDTASQSARGVVQFLEDFPEAVNGGFPNFYFISKNKSRTSTEAFEVFARSINVSMKRLSQVSLRETGINPALVSAGWAVDERVIDVSILRKLMRQRLSNASVDVRLSTEIIRVSFLQNLSKWRAYSKNGHTFESKNLVFSTYGIPITNTNCPIEWEPRTYQVTVIPVVKLNREPMGVTVMDGNFLTILPRGFSDRSLLYGPGPSVTFSTISFDEARVFQTQNQASIESSRVRTVARTLEYFPEMIIEDVDEPLVTIRALPINAAETDQRRSYVKQLGNNAYQLISGKVDHAPSVARELLSLFCS